MPDTPAPDARPRVAFTQEIRFAVVMYGGSSLAIYINGVAQELLRLVRATSPDPDDPSRAHRADAELTASERVYRRLGRLLSRCERPGEGAGAEDTISTRFVVDILTGTSAGGINAVYLAKALANDQDLEELKGLWVTEGDAGMLINDDLSYRDPSGRPEILLDPQAPARSLFNSRRMYWKLLDALRGMDRARPAARADGEFAVSPHADELDLFVTATDLPGRLMRMRLADEVAAERLHRNVFRFSYRTVRASGEDRNDFQAPYNPFLAFAARTTSAHPAAFEVVTLQDVAEVLERNRPEEFPDQYRAGDERLRQFFQEYLSDPGRPADEMVESFMRRPFNDGGVLDNSPFSFVSDVLPLRHADYPVDRKLLYIEPSPAHPELEAEQLKRPDFATNALLALSTLPSYQTIREDLTRLLERNRLIERVRRIVDGVGADIALRKSHLEHVGQQAMGQMNMADLIDKRGPSWGGYQRLRVADATDDLALLVARASGLDERSDEFLSVREIVRFWRLSRYQPNVREGQLTAAGRPYETEVAFLIRFDLMWTVRRVKFLLGKIDELYCLDGRAREVAERASGRWDGEGWPSDGDGKAREDMRDVLLALRREVNRAFTELLRRRRELWSGGSTRRPVEVPPPQEPAGDVAAAARPADERTEQQLLAEKLNALSISREDLLEILHRPGREELEVGHAAGEGGRPEDERAYPEASREAYLVGLWRERRVPFNELVEFVGARIAEATNEARGACKRLLDSELPADTLPPDLNPAALAAARAILGHYFDYFDYYDQVAYPALYSTAVGDETDIIEVFRVSPWDARSLVDERKEREAGRTVHKLAGTTLSNFGAFFERKFRVNDITWGRLDGAERIIQALLPPKHPLRATLVAEAHRAIIVEETLAQGRDGAGNSGVGADDERAAWEALSLLEGRGFRDGGRADVASLTAEQRALLEGLGARAESLPAESPARALLEGLAAGEDPREVFKRQFQERYEEMRRFTPEATLVSAARVAGVLTNMLDLYSHPPGGGRLPLRVAAGFAQWLLKAAAAVLPGTPQNRTLMLALRLLYLLGAAVTVVSWPTGLRAPVVLALGAMAATAAVYALAAWVGEYLRTRIPGAPRMAWLQPAVGVVLFLAPVALLAADRWLHLLPR